MDTRADGRYMANGSAYITVMLLLTVPAENYSLKQGISVIDEKAVTTRHMAAQKLDPQIRKLLELTWEAWMDAGIDVTKLRGGPVGVYVGCCGSDVGHVYTWTPDIGAYDGYENLGGLARRSSS